MKVHLKKALAKIWIKVEHICHSSATRVPVLCYHSINDIPVGDVDPMATDLFEEHLEHINSHYTVIPLSALADHLRESTPLPKNAMVLTFDDGYRDNYETLYPLLKKHEIPATIFLVSGFLDGRISLYGAEQAQAMSWDQAKEMAGSGLVEFGGHTDTHTILSGLPDDKAQEEIATSCNIIEQKLGTPVSLFAYPFGQGKHIPPTALETVQKRHGMKCACSTFWRTTHKPGQIYLINRVMISSGDTVNDLDLKLCGGYDYLYYWQKLRAILSVFISRKGVWK